MNNCGEVSDVLKCTGSLVMYPLCIRSRPTVTALVLLSSLILFVIYVAELSNHVESCQISHRRNTLIASYDSNVARRLGELVERRATATDPELIKLIRDLMDQPSKHMVKMSRHLMNTPQSREIDSILQKKVCSHCKQCCS